MKRNADTSNRLTQLEASLSGQTPLQTANTQSFDDLPSSNIFTQSAQPETSPEIKRENARKMDEKVTKAMNSGNLNAFIDEFASKQGENKEAVDLLKLTINVKYENTFRETLRLYDDKSVKKEAKIEFIEEAIKTNREVKSAMERFNEKIETNNFTAQDLSSMDIELQTLNDAISKLKNK